MPDPAHHALRTVFGSSVVAREKAGDDLSPPGESELRIAAGGTTAMTLGDINGDMGELVIEAPKDVTCASGKQAE